MLVKSVVKDGLTHSYYESENIRKSIYDDKKNELTLVFKTGKLYRYSSVNSGEFYLFESAESQGKTFNTILKQKHTEKIGEIDINTLSDELNEINQLELTNFKLLLNEYAKQLLLLDIESNEYTFVVNEIKKVVKHIE